MCSWRGLWWTAADRLPSTLKVVLNFSCTSENIEMCVPIYDKSESIIIIISAVHYYGPCLQVIEAT